MQNRKKADQIFAAGLQQEAGGLVGQGLHLQLRRVDVGDLEGCRGHDDDLQLRGGLHGMGASRRALASN
jgi:hypothetical protein